MHLVLVDPVALYLRRHTVRGRAGEGGTAEPWQGNGKGTGEGEIWCGVAGAGCRRAHLARRGRSAAGAMALSVRARARADAPAPDPPRGIDERVHSEVGQSGAQEQLGQLGITCRISMGIWSLVVRLSRAQPSERSKPLLTDAKDAPVL